MSKFAIRVCNLAVKKAKNIFTAACCSLSGSIKKGEAQIAGELNF